jgi:hypothetical protein
MKRLIFIFIIFFNIHGIAQEDKAVTLVVSGQGKTQDEAKQNALRSAIEQAFGTFISSKTEILNDNLVKDEIVSVANGNIQNFEIISEVKIPNGGYATSLKATVSVSKLTSFVQSKGIAVEFKGSLFAFNVNQQVLNEKNEIKAIDDLCTVVRTLSDISFDYAIKVSEPVAVNASNEKWRIPMYISVSANNNLLSIATYIKKTLKGLSLSIDEANNYIKLGKLVYPISFAANENEYDYILLRTQKGVMKLVNQLYYFNHSIQNFTVSNGLSKWEIKEYPQNLKYIYDYGFRIFIRKCYNGNVGDAYRKESVFYPNCDGSSSFWKGEKLESAESGSWCKPTLNYLDWKIEANQLDDMQTSCCSNASKKDRWGLINYDFVDQFAFVLKLNNIIKSQSGVVISFIGIIPKNEIVRFYYEDIKTLEEINKISEYKVIPIVD